MFEIITRAELDATGLSERQIERAVASGDYVRVRRGYYASRGAHPDLVRAVRVGGRLDCVSALRTAGVFGFDRDLHVRLAPNASRLRSPTGGPLARRADIRLHWGRCDSGGFVVDVHEALRQAAACQRPEHAIASIDSALHLGLVLRHDLDLPAALLSRVDARAESGQESVLRCALVDAGLDPDLQVQIGGVGRVDFLVDDRLIIEADSRLAHDGWDMHVRDRDRDLAAAELGLMTLRPTYNRIMFSPESVVRAVRGILAATDRVWTIQEIVAAQGEPGSVGPTP